MFCADGMTTEQSDGKSQKRGGWTERTVKEREEVRGDGSGGGGHEMWMNGDIIVSVSDPCSRCYNSLSSRAKRGGGQGQGRGKASARQRQVGRGGAGRDGKRQERGTGS